jgi:protease PrsW
MSYPPPAPPTDPPVGPAAQAGPAPNGGPPVQAGRSNWVRVLVLSLAGVVIAGCAIAMLLILGFSYGVQALLVGLAAAILPVPVLVACFLWLDRYEPEPPWFLAICFGWGASVATLTALGVNTLGVRVFDQVGLPESLVAVLVAPFIEELMKALGPILLLVFSRREFSGITDGIVYCGLSAVGFAMVENILYLGGHGYAAGRDEYGPASGLQLVFALFLVRILLTGFAHPLFTSMTGVGLGVAARSADRRVRWAAPIAGLLAAMLLHGTWNLMSLLSADRRQPLIMLYGYVGLMMPIFFGMIGLALWLRAWEGRLTERVLPHYVRAGWLSPPEVAALGSLGRRHSARRWARRVGGEAGRKAMREFQVAATRLALLRDGMQRGLDSTPEQISQAVAEERRLIDAIAGYRRAFVGRDPHAPVALWDGSRYHLTFPDGVRRAVDAPAEPVVPLPVVMTPFPPAPYGYQR